EASSPMSSQRILVGTRKGAFLVDKTSAGWTPRLSGHAGGCVNFMARDPATGALWALLGFGHWGAKLSRSTDGGETWADAPQVKYPEGARYFDTPMPDETGESPESALKFRDATLLKLWCAGFGGGRIWIGTIPGGQFVSEDGGESFELNRPLWNHESRGG